MPVQVFNPDLPIRSPSPTSSSATTTTLAERRQTKTSRYLGSQDFKSDFAVKLQSVRERERTALAPLPSSPSPCQIPLPLSPPAHPISFQTPHNRPTSSARSLHSSSAHSSSAVPSTSRQSADDNDDDDNGARYEVIRKLADQLSQQIETNDNLLYELGVMRASQARLLAAAADRDDELACLRQRLDAADAAVNARAAQLDQAHRALCRLQLRPSPPAPPLLAAPSALLSRRCSWPAPAVTFLPPVNPTRSPMGQTPEPDSSAPSNTSSVTEMDQLRAELRDCQDARAASEATLIAFMELFRAQPSVVDSLHTQPVRPEKQLDVDEPPAAPRRWGLGILRGGADEGTRRASVPLPAPPPPQQQQQATTSPFAGFGFPTRWRRRSDTVAPPLDEAEEAGEEGVEKEAEQRATPFRFNLGGLFGGSPRTDNVLVEHVPAQVEDGLSGGHVLVENDVEDEERRAKLVIRESGEEEVSEQAKR